MSTEMPQIKKLMAGATLDQVVAKINELIEASNRRRDRGPASRREMTEEDARRVILGDLKGSSYNDAAVSLGLSYGQVYSARKGHTFKPIYQLGLKEQRAAATAAKMK